MTVPRSASEDELLPTRRSLLDRLRDWEDQSSWREFFNTYWRFIHLVALRSGLTAQEAEDVVQETVLSVARKMPEFAYDPARCSFKGWLMHVTRLRIIDQFRRRQPTFQQPAAPETDDRESPTVHLAQVRRRGRKRSPRAEDGTRGTRPSGRQGATPERTLEDSPEVGRLLRRPRPTFLSS